MSEKYPLQKIAAIIQARIGSSRLPAKVLMKLAGKTMLAHIIERCQVLVDSGDIDMVVVATSTNEKDVECVKIAQECGVNWYQGSEEDIMRRYKEAAQKYSADIIIRVTADSPLVDIDEVRKMLAYFIQQHTQGNTLEYLHNISNTGLHLNQQGVPLGLGAEIITMNALLKADHLAVESYQREPFIVIEEHPAQFKTAFFPAPAWLQGHDFRLTVDEQADFDLIKTIYDAFYLHDALSRHQRIVTIKSSIEFLKSHPSLADINQNVNQKTYYTLSNYYQPPTIAFYCEAGTDIGLGHVMRCITLAQELQSKYKAAITFYVSDFDPALTQLSQAGFAYYALFQPPCQAPDILIIDMLNSQRIPFNSFYNLDSTDTKPKMLVLVDDLHTIKLIDSAIDLVVNSQIFVNQSYYNEFPKTTKLLGLPYLLLRSSFQKYLIPQKQLEKQQRKQLKNILVTFGGGDRLGSTLKVVNALKKISLPITITIILGAAFPFQKELQEMKDTLPTNINLVYDPNHIEDYMYLADLAFCTAGYTGYELISMGTPLVIIEQEKEQEAIIKKLVAQGAAQSLGYHDQVTEDQIITVIRSYLSAPHLLVAMRKKCFGLIDGKGCERVSRNIMMLWQRKSTFQDFNSQPMLLIDRYHGKNTT